jgi:hypothetical protein
MKPCLISCLRAFQFAAAPLQLTCLLLAIQAPAFAQEAQEGRAPSIHGELVKLGFEVSQSSVAKYMVRRRRQPSQGWRTFLRNHAPDIAAMDLFVVPTISFDLLFAFVIVRSPHHCSPSNQRRKGIKNSTSLESASGSINSEDALETSACRLNPRECGRFPVLGKIHL